MRRVPGLLGAAAGGAVVAMVLANACQAAGAGTPQYGCAAAVLTEAPVAHWEGPCFGVGVSTTRRSDLEAATGVLRYTGAKLENLINVFGQRKSAASRQISYVAIDASGAHDFTSADAPAEYRWAVQRIEAVFAGRWTPSSFARAPGVQDAAETRLKNR